MKRTLFFTFLGVTLLARPASAAPPVAEQAYSPLPPSADNSIEAYATTCQTINDAVTKEPNIVDNWATACTYGSEAAEVEVAKKTYREDVDKIIAWCAAPRKQELTPSPSQVKAVSDPLSEYFDRRSPPEDITAREAWKQDVCYAPVGAEGSEIYAGAAVAFGAKFQQQLIEALSGYLIKRAKAEALNWAGDRMGVEICKADPNGDLLLPNVCAVVFGGDKSTAPGISWSVLRQAAIHDFRDLPPRLVGFLDRLPATTKLSPQEKETVQTAALTLGSAWNVSQAIASGDNTLESIAGLASYTEPYADTLGVARVIYVAAMVAKEARVSIYDGVNTGRVWTPSPGDIDFIVAQIIQSDKLDSDFVTFLRDRLDNAHVVELIGEFTKLAALAKQGKESGADEKLQQKMLAALTEIFATSAKISRAYLKLGANDQVSCDISNPNSGQCTVLALESAGFIMGMTGALVKQEYGAAFAEFMAFYRRIIDTETLPDWFTTWLPFIADLASAKDAETMQGVLESIAAPIGSYKVKRGSIFVGLDELPSASGTDRKAKKKVKKGIKDAGGRNVHVMLNAYVGVQGGVELLLGDGGVAGHLGPTVSIGPELSWGIGPSSSFSFYVPLLDVGMLGDFRLGGKGNGSGLAATEDVEATPNIGFAQVFAPGLYMMFGLGKSPFALGLGAQIAPALRATTSTDTAIPSQDFSTLRVGGFLAIDIPVFIFR